MNVDPKTSDSKDGLANRFGPGGGGGAVVVVVVVVVGGTGGATHPLAMTSIPAAPIPDASRNFRRVDVVVAASLVAIALPRHIETKENLVCLIPLKNARSPSGKTPTWSARSERIVRQCRSERGRVGLKR